jgi:hypothetical protein
MQMEQANPLRLAGIYSGVSGSLVGQVPYGYVTLHVLDAVLCRILSPPIPSLNTMCVYLAHLTHIIVCYLFLDAYLLTIYYDTTTISKSLDIWIL